MITNLRVSIGIGVAAGAAILYAANRRRKNRSLLHRARREAKSLLKGRMARLIADSAATWISRGREETARKRKGVLEAVEAGRAAYQRVAG
jgi:hypothetical protein